MRRDVGRHTDRNAGTSVDDQIRKSGRQNNRLGQTLVIRRDKVDRVPIHIVHQGGAEMVQTGLGITHRCGWIAVNGSEVPPTLNQQMPCPPPLTHAHQGGIDRHVTVGMKITHGFTNNLGALHGLAVGLYPEAIHGVQDPALGRLESVAGVRQGAGDDDRHGVVEKRLLHLVGNIDRNNIFFHQGHDWDSGS